MKTSNFFKYTGPGRVSIARYAPRKTPAGYRIFRELAPRADMLKMEDEQEYREHYFRDILGKLEAQQVWDLLHALAGPGVEPVLLCWEDLDKPGKWCHRRMVAEWFQDQLGVRVDELKNS